YDPLSAINYILLNTAGLRSCKSIINSPNIVLAQANHLRVNRDTSSVLKDSCINPVPALEAISHLRHCFISVSFELVTARIIMPRGQIIFNPACGPPTPSAALPLKKKGFSADKISLLVFR